MENTQPAEIETKVSQGTSKETTTKKELSGRVFNLVSLKSRKTSGESNVASKTKASKPPQPPLMKTNGEQRESDEKAKPKSENSNVVDSELTENNKLFVLDDDRYTFRHIRNRFGSIRLLTNF